jgi:putative restriction endonuclease
VAGTAGSVPYSADSMDRVDDLAFRESVFTWLRTRLLTQDTFTREELSRFEYAGGTHRIVGTQTGIWRVRAHSSAAISILTAYVPEGGARPYEDAVGPDGMLRYKYRGTDPQLADNVWLRRAMEQRLPLVWFVGIRHVPGTKRQLFAPQFPVWLVAEEPDRHQFVVAVEEAQAALPVGATAEVIDITRRYNERIVRERVHQPLFRTAVLQAYERRCAVCSLPFTELLDAAHIKPDAAGGLARVTNGLSLCKIHHGAFDSQIIGISPDYVVHVRESVLRTFDGPTLQHAIKGMDGESLRQVPRSRSERPDRDLLAERFERFQQAS